MAASYTTLLRFVVPLACVNFIHDFSEQVVDAGIARDPSATNAESTLAAFGICWYLCVLTTSVIGTVQQVALVLGRTPSSKRSILRLYACASACAAAGFIFVGLVGPASDIVFIKIHQLSGPTLQAAQLMIVTMAGFPPLMMVKKFYYGILSAQKATGVISAAAMVNVFGVVVTVISLRLVQPANSSWSGWEPVLALYVGESLDLAIVATPAIRRLCCGDSTVASGPASPSVYSLTRADVNVSVWMVARFCWPLVLRETTMGLSRPMINLWVARGADGTEQLSVLVLSPRHNYTYRNPAIF
jgi:hypothetical protein